MSRLGIALTLLVSLAPRARADERPTVAVLYFDYAGKDDALGVLRKGLAQMMISDLSSLPEVRLVERTRLEEVLAELKLSQSGKIDQASAARVGKLLGARYLVLGSYFDMLGVLRADARVVEVETGRVIRSVGANGKPDDFMALESSLVQSVGGVLGKELHAPAPAPPPRVAPPAKLRTKTAVEYSRALAAKDRGDKREAKERLQAVVKEQPDFRLASLELENLAR
jgi:TolB-like protein